jgi:tetratricopeptide (TPR) repeat protein
VSEESERVGSGPEGNGAGVDPTAVALALAGASREDASAFLKKQGQLIDDQRRLASLQIDRLEAQDEHFREEAKLELTHLRWRRFTEQMRGVLQFLTAVVGIAVATAFGMMVWDAAHSSGLIIEPFTVPADMAAKGLTGQAIASQMLDKIIAMESVAGSNRAAQTYANNWGSNIKVQIPETGVSIGEFRQFLRDWLGHDTHITGEIYHTDAGLVITARTSGATGGSFTGPQTDLDLIVQKAAEYVYGNTQPNRYAQFLLGSGRGAEGSAIYRRLTEDPSRLERAWAWTGLANIPRGQFDYAGTLGYYRKAISDYPDFPPAYHLAAWFERVLSHPEAALEKYRRAKALFDQSAVSQFETRHVPKMRQDTDMYIAFLSGDFDQAVRLGQAGDYVANASGTEVNFDTFRNATAVSLGLQHDGIHARPIFSQMLQPQGSPFAKGRVLLWRSIARVRMDAALEDWPAVAAAEASAEKIAVFPCPVCQLTKVFRVELLPWLALAKTRTGDIAGGEAMIAASPVDCYDCNLIRGQIAEVAKQPGRADYWFARAVHDAPSIPFAYADWGQALLERGQPNAAIAKFTIANQKGPHFADPLEGWGEALMSKNQSHLALAKFAEAEKYAPNWGRLHLKWGEALYYAGKRDDAKAQFVRAGQLDLTPSEKAELARMGHV